MSIYQVVFGMPKSKVKWTLWDFFSILPQPYFNFNLSPKIVIFCEDPEYFSGPKGKIDHKGFSQMGVGGGVSSKWENSSSNIYFETHILIRSCSTDNIKITDIKLRNTANLHF